MKQVIPVPLPGGMSAVHEIAFLGALGAATRAPGFRLSRADSEHGEYADDANAAAAAMFGDPASAIDMHRFRYFQARADSVAREFEVAHARHGERADAADYDPGQGVHLARDLEYRTRKILEEKFPLPDVFDLFPSYDDPPPIGAETWTMRRISQFGEAGFWNGSSADVKRVGVTQAEERRPVRHICTGWSIHMFERNAAAYAASVNTYEARVKAARRVIYQTANRVLWHGAPSVDLYGVTSLPWLDKYVISVPFTAAQASTFAGAMAIVRAVIALIEHPKNKSANTFMPTVLATTNRLYTFLATTVIPDTAGQKILQFIQETCPTKVRWVTTAYLDRVGPGGTDGLLAFRDDQEGIALVLPVPYNVMPANAPGGLVDEFFAWMTLGGAVSPEVGNNVLAWGSLG